MINDFDIDSDKLWLFLAGVVGGMISFRFVPGMNWKQKIFSVLSGAGMAVFLSPLLAQLWGIEDKPKVIAGIACSIGLFGLAVCDSIFERIKTDGLAGILKAKRGE